MEEQHIPSATSHPAVTPPVYSPPYAPQPRIPSDAKDTRLAIALVVLTILAVNFSLFGGWHTGYAVSYLALLLCGFLYLRPHLRPITGYGMGCTLAAVAAAGLFVWHNDPVIHFFGVCGVSLLLGLALLEATGVGRRDSGTPAVFWDVCQVLIGRPLTHLSTAISAIFLVEREGQLEKRRCGGVLLGLLCALPVLVVVVPLLISADAAFEGLLQHTVLDHLGEMFLSVCAGLALFALLFSRWFSLRHPLPQRPATPATPRRGISSMALNAFLGTIAGVYVLYLFSQLAYFFSAFSGILPKGFTVAQYARRGFFEMATLCAINLGLAAITLWLSRKQEGKAPLSTRLIVLFILTFSLGLVATALSKMALYIDSFGMTRLRILTAVFMVMLAVILLFVAVRLFAVRFPYMKAIVLCIACIGLLVGYVDVDTYIAHHNVTAYKHGELAELDLYTLESLSDGAVPYLVALWDERADDAQGQQLNDALYNRMYRYWERDTEKDTFRFDEKTDFRRYNVDEARAKALLRDRAEEILAQRQAYLNQWATDRDEDTFYDDWS